MTGDITSPENEYINDITYSITSFITDELINNLGGIEDEMLSELSPEIIEKIKLIIKQETVDVVTLKNIIKEYPVIQTEINNIIQAEQFKESVLERIYSTEFEIFSKIQSNKLTQLSSINFNTSFPTAIYENVVNDFVNLYSEYFTKISAGNETNNFYDSLINTFNNYNNSLSNSSYLTNNISTNETNEFYDNETISNLYVTIQNKIVNKLEELITTNSLFNSNVENNINDIINNQYNENINNINVVNNGDVLDNQTNIINNQNVIDETSINNLSSTFTENVINNIESDKRIDKIINNTNSEIFENILQTVSNRVMNEYATEMVTNTEFINESDIYNIGGNIFGNEEVNNYYNDEIVNIKNEIVNIKNETVDRVVQMLITQEQKSEESVSKLSKDISYPIDNKVPNLDITHDNVREITPPPRQVRNHPNFKLIGHR